MANSGFSFMLIKEVLDSIARAYKWQNYDLTNMQPPDASLPQQEVIKVPQELIRASIGQYRLDDEDTFRICEKKQHLFIDWPGEGEAEIFATASGRMFCASLPFGSPWLTFVRADKGKRIVTKILAAHDGNRDCQKFCVLSPVDLTIDLEPIAEHHGKLRLCRTPFASRHLPLLGDLAQLYPK